MIRRILATFILPALLATTAAAAPDSPAVKPLVIWPLGDSITVGAGIPGGYRSPLYEMLTQAGYQVRFTGSDHRAPTPVLTASGNTGHDGHGSYPSFLLAGNLDQLPKMPVKPSAPNSNNGGFWLTGTNTRPPIEPDVILLMAGTNDLGMFQRTPEQLLKDYDALLTKLTTLRPKAAIIAAALAPYSGKPVMHGRDYRQREAKQVTFNAALPALVDKYRTAGHRVFFYDMRRHLPVSSASTTIGGDGVHPTQAGYEAIARGWFEAMQENKLLPPPPAAVPQ